MVSYVDDSYMSMINTIMEYGEEIETRNSKVKRVCGVHVTFVDTPLITIRKTAWKQSLLEMEWFVSGSNDINKLDPSVRPWWQPWADENGLIHSNYSQQLRACAGLNRVTNEPIICDQLELFIAGIKNHPYSRRNVITTWNSAEMYHESCKLTNCHLSYLEAFVTKAGELHFLTMQRSVDVLCGLPHNWVQLRALQMWVAHRTGWTCGRTGWVGADVHIYEAHNELVRELQQVYYEMEQAGQQVVTPQLVYTPTSEEFKAADFTLDREYSPIVKTKAEMIV